LFAALQAPFSAETVLSADVAYLNFSIGENLRHLRAKLFLG